MHHTAFVRVGAKEGYRVEFHSGGEDPRVRGDDGFLASVLKGSSRPMKLPTLGWIIQAVCVDYGLTRADLSAPTQSRVAAEARAVVGWLASEFGSGTFAAVGEELGRDISTISSAVRRLSERASRDGVLSRRLERMKATWPKLSKGSRLVLLSAPEPPRCLEAGPNSSSEPWFSSLFRSCREVPTDKSRISCKAMGGEGNLLGRTRRSPRRSWRWLCA